MSAWQFKTELLPIDGLIAHHGCIPKQLTTTRLSDAISIDNALQETDELLPYWSNFSNVNALEMAICELLPERDSWSELARMFGVNGKDEIEIWRTEDGSVFRICPSFCLSNPDAEFIRSSLACASSFKCVFLGIQSRQIFSPSMAEFVTHAEKCSAARFVPIEKPLSSMLT